MKTFIKALLAATIMLTAAVPANAASHYSKRPHTIHLNSNAGCVLFALVGVTLSDPNGLNKEFFAIPKSHPHYNEFLAMLLTSKGADLPISVVTSGTRPPECVEFVTVDTLTLN